MMKSTCVVKCLAMMGLICAAMTAQAAVGDAPAYRWLFEAKPSANQGTGGDVKMTIGDGATLGEDTDAGLTYAAFTDDGANTSKKSARTSANIILSDAQAITVSFYLRNPTASASSVLFETSDDYNHGTGRILIGHIVVDGQDLISLGVLTTTSPSYSNVDAKGLSLRDGQWHHVALVLRTGCDWPNQAAIYIDGARATLTKPDEGDVKVDASTRGLEFANEVGYFCGRAGAAKKTADLADLSIFKRELSQEEVYALFLRTKDGVLIVDQADDASGTSSPAIGGHEGYQEGDVVPFSWTADGGAVEANRAWVLSTNGVTVKRGFGNCGSFVHDGGRMHLAWTTAADGPVSDYHWMLDASPSPNMGPSDVKMTFGADVDVSNGYAAFTGQGSSCAVSSSAIDLSAASAVTLTFMLRNPEKKDGGVLVEQSANYVNASGAFYIGYANLGGSDGEQLSLNVRYKIGEGYSLLTANNLCLHDGKWHKIVVIFRKAAYQKNMALYVDGVAAPLTKSDNDTNHQKSTEGMTFANEKFYLCGRGGSGKVAADLKDVAIYKRELSAAEIQGGSLLTTAKGCEVTGVFLPCAPFGSTRFALPGEIYSFTFGDTPLYSVDGGKKVNFQSWALYRKDGETWTPWQSGRTKSFEFVYPGGDVKLELKFGSGFAILLK